MNIITVNKPGKKTTEERQSQNEIFNILNGFASGSFAQQDRM